MVSRAELTSPIFTIQSNTQANIMAVKSYVVDADHDFHSYLLRISQPFRVVLRLLHYTALTVDIINSLSDLGHKLISTSNIPTTP